MRTGNRYNRREWFANSIRVAVKRRECDRLAKRAPESVCLAKRIPQSISDPGRRAEA